jgi:hypothetical protein
MIVARKSLGTFVGHFLMVGMFLAGTLFFGHSANAQSDSETKATEKITFSNQVVRIFQRSCQECHRPGQMAPMSLLTYEETRPWAKSIKKKVASRQMPPWHADPKYGEFVNDRSLSDEDIDTIVRWVDSGTLRGNPKDLPKPITFTDGWSIGEPDLILSMNRPYTVRASGRDTFENFHINTRLTEDRFVSAVEIMPGDRRVVHHVLAYVHQNDNFNFRDEESWSRSIGQGGTMLIEYAVGNKGDIFEDGTGRLLKKGSRLLLQIHYHPYGEATQDVTKVGLKFHPRGTEHRRVISRWIGTRNLSIRPNTKDIMSRSSHTFRRPVNIVSFQPHMHCRGQAMKAEVFYPDGRNEILCDVPNYDFNWQTTFTFKQPPYLPAGTRMVVTGMHDNTVGNPNNPNANAYVSWGQSTFDEMMHGWTDFVYAEEEGVWPTSEAAVQSSIQSAESEPVSVFASRSSNASPIRLEPRSPQSTAPQQRLTHSPSQPQIQEAPVRKESDGLPFLVKFLAGISIAGLGVYVVFLRS